MIDASMDKIQAIKALREACLKAFGVTPPLKESKDFIENCIVPFSGAMQQIMLVVNQIGVDRAKAILRCIAEERGYTF